jgi:hypothetical protein
MVHWIESHFQMLLEIYLKNPSDAELPQPEMTLIHNGQMLLAPLV